MIPDSLADAPPSAKLVWCALDRHDGPMITKEITEATQLARCTVNRSIREHLDVEETILITTKGQKRQFEL